MSLIKSKISSLSRGNTSKKIERVELNEEQRSRGQSCNKEGDNERILIMNMVKSGSMSIENAMQAAYGLGVASSPYESMHESSTESRLSMIGEKVYSFGVHRYSKFGVVKCILQLDFQEQIMCFIVNGTRETKYSLRSIRFVDSDDGSSKLSILLNDRSELEFDASNIAEKNQLLRLLDIVLQQSAANRQSIVSIIPDESESNPVIKESCLEKRGHSAAALLWTKRFVRVRLGQLMYYKMGEQKNPDSALNFVKLGPGLAFAKKLESNGFIVVTGKKEYSFRIPSNTGMTTEDVQRERDDWIIAIQEASRSKLNAVEEQNVELRSSASDQETFLKDLIKTLHEQLEQLQAIFSIIDAPVKATVQVRTIRETVTKLDEQVKLGLLSWTLKSSSQLSSPHSPSASLIYPQFHGRSIDSESSYSTLDRNYLLPDNARPFSWADSDTSNQTENLYVDNPLLDLTRQTEPGVIISNSPPLKTKKINQRDAKKQYMKTMSLGREQSLNVSSSGENYGQGDGFASGSNLGAAAATATIYETHDYEGDSVPPMLPAKGSKSSGKSSNDAKSQSLPGRNKIDQLKQLRVTSPDSEITDIPSSTPEVDSTNHSQENVPLPPGVPKPPPLPGSLTLDLPAKQEFNPSKKLKSLFWSKIPERCVKDSLWYDFQDKSSSLDLTLLERMFESEGGKTEKKLIKQPTVTGPESLLNPKKAQNVGIFLGGFKLDFSDIGSKLAHLDGEESLPLEYIVSLKRFKPTAEECELFKNFTGSANDLPLSDQFMLTLSKVSHLEEKLDVLLAAIELPDEYKITKSSTEMLLKSAKELRDNKDFHRLLQYILTIGNFINGGTARGGAYGFSLSSLVKLIDVRTTDKKKNLLQFIVEQLYDKDLDALKCYEKVETLLSPTELSLKGLGGEVEVMKKELSKVEGHLSLLKKTQSPSEQDLRFADKVQSFLGQYQQNIEVLTKSYCEAEQLSNEVLHMFGEISTFNFQDWLQNVSNFFRMLQIAVTEESDKRKRKSRTVSATMHSQADVATEAFNADEIQTHQGTIPQHSVSIKQKKTSKNSAQSRQQELPNTNRTSPKLSEKFQEANTATQASKVLPSSGVVKVGNLDKLSGGKHRAQKWDTRMFELMDTGYLHYYKKQGDKKPTGSIYLPGCPVMQDFENPTFITIETEDREWCFKAASKTDAKSWVEAMLQYANRMR